MAGQCDSEQRFVVQHTRWIIMMHPPQSLNATRYLLSCTILSCSLYQVLLDKLTSTQACASVAFTAIIHGPDALSAHWWIDIES